LTPGNSPRAPQLFHRDQRARSFTDTFGSAADNTRSSAIRRHVLSRRPAARQRLHVSVRTVRLRPGELHRGPSRTPSSPRGFPGVVTFTTPIPPPAGGQFRASFGSHDARNVGIRRATPWKRRDAYVALGYSGRRL